MADVIIITIIAIAVFFIVRGELRKLRRGQCSGGCAGCDGSCRSCSGCAEMPAEKAQN